MGREGGIQGRGKVSSLQNNAGELGENAGVCELSERRTPVNILREEGNYDKLTNYCNGKDVEISERNLK